jgi:hypothetical protein
MQILGISEILFKEGKKTNQHVNRWGIHVTVHPLNKHADFSLIFFCFFFKKDGKNLSRLMLFLFLLAQNLGSVLGLYQPLLVRLRHGRVAPGHHEDIIVAQCVLSIKHVLACACIKGGLLPAGP